MGVSLFCSGWGHRQRRLEERQYHRVCRFAVALTIWFPVQPQMVNSSSIGPIRIGRKEPWNREDENRPLSTLVTSCAAPAFRTIPERGEFQAAERSASAHDA